MRALLLLVVACGPRVEPAAPVDYGPPAAPIDPIACPADTLERFAARVGVPPAITTEQIVDASRVDKLPCKAAETNDACLARARARPAPTSYELAGVTIANEVTSVEYTYDLNGRRLTETASSMEELVTKLKALSAQGNKVTIVRAESAGDGASRHAAIVYRGVGGRERRLVTLTWQPDDTAAAMADTQAAAERERIEIRSMALDDKNNLVVVGTCGA
jgi:hypothetical protein